MWTSEGVPVLLHVGYHKTGTTWFQRVVFDSSVLGFNSPFDTRWCVQRIALMSDRDYSHRNVGAELHDVLRERARSSDVAVLSHERFSGSPFAGGYDSSSIARRLHELMPSARVLLTIREQRSAILSCYRQYVRDGGRERLVRWLNPSIVGRGLMPTFDAGFFRYDRLVGLYRSLFGEESVLVLPIEGLREFPVWTLRDLLEFCGLPQQREEMARVLSYPAENRGLSAPACAVKRQLNRYLRSTLHPSGLIDSQRLASATRVCVDWCDRWSARGGTIDERLLIEKSVGDMYQESNRRLAAWSSYDLSSIGYAC